MALHAKHGRLTVLRPDVAVVPECANPEILRRKAPDFAFTDCEWHGVFKDKGLGVFSFGDFRLRRHESWDPQHHVFLPVEVRGPSAFNLLAVWSFNYRKPYRVTAKPARTGSIVEQYSPFLREANSVVAGDFNASVFWDTGGRYESFAALDRTLGEVGLVSAYHAVGGHALGAEPAGTLFWQRKATQQYHIDYAYVPREWIPRICEASVGGVEEWLPHSDHAPLVVEVSDS